MSLPILFLSFDVEADGKAPGLSSMLSVGLAGFDSRDGRIAFEYEANLCPLPDARPDPDTLAWWLKPEQAEAWQHVHDQQRDPSVVFQELAEKIVELQKSYQIRSVAWPIAYDWQWINYYFHRFVGRNPLGYTGTDIGSYAQGVLRLAKHSEVGSLDRYADPKLAHTHRALDDAKEQGMKFYNLWKSTLAR